MELFLGFLFIGMMAFVVVTLWKDIKWLRVVSTVIMGLIFLITISAGVGIADKDDYIAGLEENLVTLLEGTDDWGDCIIDAETFDGHRDCDARLADTSEWIKKNVLKLYEVYGE